MQALSLYSCVIWGNVLNHSEASQVALVVRNPPANAGDKRNPSLVPCLEDSLEEGMATHSSVLAQISPQTEKPGRLQSVHSDVKSGTRLNRFSTHAQGKGLCMFYLVGTQQFALPATVVWATLKCLLLPEAIPRPFFLLCYLIPHKSPTSRLILYLVNMTQGD